MTSLNASRKFRSTLCGSVKVVFESSWADRYGTHKRPMPRDEADVVAIVPRPGTSTTWIRPDS